MKNQTVCDCDSCKFCDKCTTDDMAICAKYEMWKRQSAQRKEEYQMTLDQAIRILDPATTAEELATIEYYGGLHGREKMVAACDEACRIAVDTMRKYMEENDECSK